ncbi:MAG: universal stress protein [Myxococcota bacterium]
MKRILVAIDLSDVTGAMLETASALAAQFEAKLYLVHVAKVPHTYVAHGGGAQFGFDPAYTILSRDEIAHQLRDEHRELQEHGARLEAEGIQVAALLMPGDPIVKILDEAEKLDVDLIVMGSHGHGAIYELLVGSVTEGVLRRTRRPVLVVPSEREPPQSA